MSAADEVRITFEVEVPDSTPAGSAICISGNLPALGNWNGAGVKLAPSGGRWIASVALPRAGAVEFKVTRGGWETVEKGSAGEEIANRRFTAARDDTVRARVLAWRDQTEAPALRPSTRAGDIRDHPAFASRHVRPRDVWVYLPPGYDADSTLRYPVLYFHDGNNVFDSATSFIGVEWGVDEVAERLIRAGAVPPFIAVAVANTPDRMAEYTPTADGGHGGGRAADYARFLIEELMPFVDRAYRTRTGPEHTGVVGSSLGGNVSLYLGLEHPDHFGRIGCVSPAAWWGDRDVVKRAARVHPGLRVWLDVGTAESTPTAGRSRWLEDARALRDALVRSGYRTDRDLHYEEVAGAAHDERAWAARVDRILRFLLDANRPAPAAPPR